MIQVQNLVKWYGPLLAVDDVSFDVQKGEVLGFLGPNGAGKSTTMRMITGFLPASSGTVHVENLDISEHGTQARAQIGYLPENAPAYPEMSVQAFLEFIADIHLLQGKARDKAIERVMEICHLSNIRHQTIDTLSKGYRRRTCLAQSMLADSPNLVLDEPTEGLDPNQKREVRELIRNMAHDKAIILSTHILEEVQAICDRLIIIDQGKLICNGTPDELCRRSSDAGTVTVRIKTQDSDQIRTKLEAISGVKNVTVLTKDQETATLTLQPSASDETRFQLADAVAEKLSEENLTYNELHTSTGSLETFFQEVTVSETEQENAA